MTRGATSTERSAAPPSARAFWRGYWITLRPYLFWVSGAAGMVGLAIAGNLPPLQFGFAFLAFFLSYGLGQALTDVFQIDTDSLSSPYRPLVRGEITRGSVVVVSLLGLAACTTIFVVLNPWTLIPCLLAVAGLLTYTPIKRHAWGGPAWNAGVIALLPVIGLLSGIRSPARALAHPLLPRAVASVFFSYAVFVILGYLKDVEADRATGYQTAPVRFGRRWAVAMSAVFLSGGSVASVALVWSVIRSGFSVAHPWVVAGGLLWAAGLIFLAVAHGLAAAVERDDDAHPAIALAVRGFVAMHLGEAALLSPPLAPLALLLYLLFEAALGRRPCRTQI